MKRCTETITQIYADPSGRWTDEQIEALIRHWSIVFFDEKLPLMAVQINWSISTYNFGIEWPQFRIWLSKFVRNRLIAKLDDRCSLQNDVRKQT